MSDARENGDRGKQQTNEAALSARLQRLSEGLGHARNRPADLPMVLVRIGQRLHPATPGASGSRANSLQAWWSVPVSAG